jgi:arabinogalactan oligomer/maltooligosaccharide transport system substrate-binding protein
MKPLKYSSLIMLIIMMLFLSACGGGTETATTAPSGGGAGAAATDTPAAAGGAATNTPAAAGGAATDTPAAAAAATDTPAAAGGGAATTPTVAPTPTAVSLGSSSAKTTINIGHGWAGDYLAAKQAVFAAYVQAHPDVAIKLLNVPSIGDKVKNAVPAGVGPDIIAWVDDNIGQNALIGVIDPLDGKGGIDQNYLKQNFPEVAANAVTYNGQIYGLPETLEAITFFYNKKLITADKLPKTTTELKQMMTDYNKANPGQYFAVWNPTDAYFNAPWFYGAGAQYVDPDGNAHLDTPEALAAAQWIRGLQGLMPKDIDTNVADALFNDGKAPIELSGPWRVADLQKAKMDFGLAKIPAVDFGKKGPARPFVGVKTLMLAHGSKNADIAVDIMKFYTSAEQQQTMAKATGEVPANTAAAAALASDPIVKGFNDQAVDGVPLPNTPFMGALWDPAAKAYTALWTGSADPQQIMNDSQKVAEAALAKMK